MDGRNAPDLEEGWLREDSKLAIRNHFANLHANDLRGGAGIEPSQTILRNLQLHVLDQIVKDKNLEIIPVGKNFFNSDPPAVVPNFDVEGDISSLESIIVRNRKDYSMCVFQLGKLGSSITQSREVQPVNDLPPMMNWAKDLVTNPQVLSMNPPDPLKIAAVKEMGAASVRNTKANVAQSSQGRQVNLRSEMSLAWMPLLQPDKNISLQFGGEGRPQVRMTVNTTPRLRSDREQAPAPRAQAVPQPAAQAPIRGPVEGVAGRPLPERPAPKGPVIYNGPGGPAVGGPRPVPPAAPPPRPPRMNEAAPAAPQRPLDASPEPLARNSRRAAPPERPAPLPPGPSQVDLAAGAPRRPKMPPPRVTPDLIERANLQRAAELDKVAAGKAPAAPQAAVEAAQKAALEQTSKRRYLECPLTMEPMVNPVITPSGISYDADGLRDYSSGKDPTTDKPLTAAEILPNQNLKQEIAFVKARSAPGLYAHSNQSAKVPEHYKCPLTKQLMDNPVVVPVMVDGNRVGISYERAAVATFIEQNKTYPGGLKPAPGEKLIPNLALREGMDNWKKMNNIVAENLAPKFSPK